MRDAVFILLLIAAGQGIFLSLILTLGKERLLSTRLLGLMFLAFSLQLFDFVLLYSGKAEAYPHLLFISTPFNLALGPLLYLYAKSSTRAFKELRPIQLLHFLPFLAHAVYLIAIYHSQTVEYKIGFIRDIIQLQSNITESGVGGFNVVFAIFVYGQLAIYLMLSKGQLNSTNKYQSEMLQWVRKVWLAILVIGAFALLQFLLLAASISQQPVTGYIAGLLAVIYVYYGAMIVVRKPEVVFSPPTKEKYQYSTLQSADSDRILQKLKNHIQSSQVYKDPELTLKTLSKLSGISERHISQVINDKLDQNFKDFINAYRVEEFKSQLVNPNNEHLSLLGIAMDCGFNSKSTFNSAFKRSTGLTPTEYKQSLK